MDFLEQFLSITFLLKLAGMAVGIFFTFAFFIAFVTFARSARITIENVHKLIGTLWVNMIGFELFLAILALFTPYWAPAIGAAIFLSIQLAWDIHLLRTTGTVIGEDFWVLMFKRLVDAISSLSFW